MATDITTPAPTETRALALRERLDLFRSDLARFTPEKYNVCVPAAAQEFSPLFRPVFTVVTVNPDPKSDAKDVYEPPGGGAGQLAFHHTALNRMSNAAGITWESAKVTKSGRWTWDAEIAGWMIHPNGDRIRIPGSYTLDVEEDGVIVKRIRAKAEGRAKAEAANRQKHLDGAERDIDSYRQFGRQRAETGARSRVIRAAANMKATYSPREIAKPFVFVLYRPDENHPEVQRALVDRMRRTSAEVFGARELPASIAGVVREVDAGHGDESELLGHIEGEAREVTEAPAAAAPHEPEVIDPEPTAPPDARAVEIRAHVAKIVADLRGPDGRPWTRDARNKPPTEKQVGMVAGQLAKATGVDRQLSPEGKKAIRRAVLAYLFGAFMSYDELRSEQASATIDWSRDFEPEVRELLAYLVTVDETLAAVREALTQQPELIGAGS